MRQIKKGDVIVFISAVVCSLAAFFCFSFSLKPARSVVIKQNNEIVYNDSISKDTAVSLGGNTAVIKDKKVFMESADCKNQVCVKSGTISKKGEIIICAPNKITIEIK